MDEDEIVPTNSTVFHKVVGSSYQLPDARNLDDEISMNMYFEPLSKQNDAESPGLLRSVDGTELVSSLGDTNGFARGIYSTYYGYKGQPELWSVVGPKVFVKSSDDNERIREVDGKLSKSSGRVFFAEPGGVARSVLVLEREAPTLLRFGLSEDTFAAAGTHISLPKNPYRVDSSGNMEQVVSTCMMSIANRIVVNDKGTGQIFVSRPGAFSGTANVYQYRIVQYDGEDEKLIVQGITGDQLQKYMSGHSDYVAKIMYKDDGHTPDYAEVSLESDGSWNWMSDTGSYQYETALAYSGDTVVAMECINNNRLVVFGNRSFDIWDLSSDTNGYYALDNSSNGNNIGCASPDSVARISDNVCWLGAGKDGFNGIWMLTSDGLKKISTPALDRKLFTISDKSDSFGFAYTHAGHMFYILTIPSAKMTIAYDLSTGYWHNRSTIEDDGTDGFWKPIFTTEFNGGQYFLSYFGNSLVRIADGKFTEWDGRRIRRKRRWAPIVSAFSPVIVNEMRIECGVGLTNILEPTTDGHATEGYNPTVIMRCSPDGIRFGNAVESRLGLAGNYGSECRWQQLGMGKYFVIELVFTDPVDFYIFDSKIRYLTTGRF